MYKKISWNLISPSLKPQYKKLFFKLSDMINPQSNMNYFFNDTDKGVIKISIEFERNKLYFSLLVNDQKLFHFILIKSPTFLFFDWELLEEDSSMILKTEEDFNLIFSLLNKKERFLKEKEQGLYNILKEVEKETNGIYKKV